MARIAAFNSSRFVVYDWRISAVLLNTMTMPGSASVEASMTRIASSLAQSSRVGFTSVAFMLAELSTIKM